MIIETNNINELRKQIQKIKKQKPEEKIIVKAQDEEFNRKALENANIDILLSPEIHNRKDYLKQRDSGLNEHLMKLAKKNNIKIAINIPEIASLPTLQKARILSRISQNIRLAKKIKAKIRLYPEEKYNNLDIISFFKTFHGSTEQIKD